MKQIILACGKITYLNDEDAVYFSYWPWHRTTWGYAARRYNSRKLYLHIEILKKMGFDMEGKKGDHKDRNKLNNQRNNLRIATRTENGMNRSINSKNTTGYKGVCYVEKIKKYKVAVRRGTKYVHVGYFDSLEEAAKAYDIAAIKLHGEFSSLNFPGEL